MKKQLLTAVTLLATLSELSAGLLDNTLNTAGNLVEDVVDVPGDVLYGPDYDRDGWRDGGWRRDRGYYDHHHGLFGRRYYRD